MKQFKFVAAALMLMVGVANAWADEPKPVEQAIHAQLVKVDNSGAGANVKISPDQYPNGVFVQAKELFGERPVTSAIFANKLHSLGFKIAEKAEDADVVFLIRSSTINFKEIDQNVDGVDARKTDRIAGAAIAALATGGLSLLATDLSFSGNKKPVYTDMVVFLKDPKKTSSTTTLITGSIKTDASNAKVTRATFEIFSEEWLKAHVTGYADRKDINTQPVSAASVTQSMADAKSATPTTKQ